ncbi:ESX-1 secretion-associated protein [Nocardia salmonicida]|uniref:ESX-1 secretion-associated protein n=1 Tax=Nocardia salmonicida TaxID=53431 RepID=UPI0007A4D754|nr:ESX-1 secretion-associated protein [Nocardia salmonicida]
MSIPGGDGQSLTVVPEKVREVGNYVYGLADTLRQALDSAAREVDACAGSSWTGDYADTFASGWSETRTGGAAIMTALTEMAEKLGVTADTYTQRDETNSAALGSFSLDLPGL